MPRWCSDCCPGMPRQNTPLNNLLRLRDSSQSRSFYMLLELTITNHLLEFAGMTFIGYSFRHRKTPHFLVQVLYHTCLTNGVQFKTGWTILFFHFSICTGGHSSLIFEYTDKIAGRQETTLFRNCIDTILGLPK